MHKPQPTGGFDALELSGTTLEALAAAYNIPAHPLVDTVNGYNQGIDRQDKDAFGKELAKAQRIDRPPFYAIRLWPKVHYTMGGVGIDTDARVVDLDQKPIEGLYAAGEITGGVHGACRLGSCAITECLVFGRIAGRNAAVES